MIIRQAQPQDLPEIVRMRATLFPECTAAEHAAELGEIFAAAGTSAPGVTLARDGMLWVAQRPNGKLAAFLECSLRKYADGCTISPVPYMEAWYTDEDVRRRGIGGMLVAAFELWARNNGYAELGSDCLVANEVSHAAHKSLGFKEAERLIHFRKELRLAGG